MASYYFRILSALLVNGNDSDLVQFRVQDLFHYPAIWCSLIIFSILLRFEIISFLNNIGNMYHRCLKYAYIYKIAKRLNLFFFSFCWRRRGKEGDLPSVYKYLCCLSFNPFHILHLQIKTNMLLKRKRITHESF